MKEEQNYLEPVSVQPDILMLVDKTDLIHQEYNDLVQMAREVIEVKVYTQWLLGKIGDAVSKKHGDIKKFAEDIELGIKVGSLYQYIFTYRAYTKEDPNFTPDRYHGSVPWGMLQYVGSKSSEPIKKLNKLIDAGVRTAEGAIRSIKTEENGESIPFKPKVSFKWDIDKKKWVIHISVEDWEVIDWSEVEAELTKALKIKLNV